MIQIDDTVVSFELFDEHFLCDLNHCKGICCIEGDSGAPLETGEVELLEKVLPEVWQYLSPKSKEIIEKQGVAYEDADGDMVTSIVHGRECVFTYIDSEGICKCAIERAYKEGKTTFRKPISCHLYPIRLAQYAQFTALNYHKWQVCSCALKLGLEKKIAVYKFLKEPLIRKFGTEWYEQLEFAANDYYFHTQKGK